MSSKRTTPEANPSVSPVRIYILWHPDMDKSEFPELRDRGTTLARRIYHWFRMENMEGIPVYFRSAAAPGVAVPPPVDDDDGVRNYLITLVDAHMVASPAWRLYISELAERSLSADAGSPSGAGPKRPGEYHFLPVAMESVAYNMPAKIRSLNFIRHIPRGEKAPDDLELLAKVTEVLCRDLRHWLGRETAGSTKPRLQPGPPGKIKIFISHAKADETHEAVAIKDYIQRETQCEAFFDETDIASGYDFAAILNDAISGDSAGLIVLQGDNYADRPWCRKEIRDFLQPIEEPLARGEPHEQYVFAPVVVVQKMKGKQVARTIPELGYSPSVYWQEDRPDTARFVVTMLLREICFGLFYRILARRVAQFEHEDGATRIYLNRSPDPVMINRIIADRAEGRKRRKNAGKLGFVYPGYGLSKMEHEGLSTAFPGHEFRSFLGVRGLAGPAPLDLHGRIIALSAGNPGDLLAKGLGEEHIQELLVRLLRPLLQANASLLYGGAMPKTFRPERPWEEPVNFTTVLLQLLLGDRDTGKNHPDPPRLFVPVPCHRQPCITASLVAQWSDVCSFVQVSPEDSGITPEELDARAPNEPGAESGVDPGEDLEAFVASRCALEARAYSAMRRKICDRKHPLVCVLPDPPDSRDPSSAQRKVGTFAHIFIGGKLTGFSGIMQGVFEEALCAFNEGKPVFLIAEYGGATAALAKWLLDPPETRPVELTPEYHAALPAEAGKPGYSKMIAGLDRLPADTPLVLTPAEAFDRLWAHIQSARAEGGIAALLNNGLGEKENRDLLNAESSGNICRAVWDGISHLRAMETRAPNSL